MNRKKFLQHEGDYGLTPGFGENGSGKFLGHHSSVPTTAYTGTVSDKKELNEEDQILKNGQLFNAIRKNITSEEKSRKIQKHLNEGAAVNAKDANNKNNTPLHIAVLKGEPEIVKLLLKSGANTDNKNSDNKTPLDIAELSDTPNGQDIVNILKASHQTMLTISCPLVEQSSLVKNPLEQSQSSDQSSVQQQSQRKRNKDDIKGNQQEKSQFHYSKRPGTSGLSGQLYETKLLTLLLFRALNDKEINEFYLGTNVDGVGALDDIIFRYNLNGQEKSRVKFIQAKHKDNPDKEKVTVTEVLKKDKDFSLNKYLDSYLSIKQRFNPESNDDLFKGNFRDMNSEFVIYTTAIDDFSKKKVLEQLNTSKDDLIYTSQTGKTFQFEYKADDINLFMKTASESRTKLLGESLAKFILSDKSNYSKMMSDELIKTYHVVLAQKVIEVFGIESVDYRKGKFRPEFFSSDENLLSILRKTLYKETVLCKKSKLLPKDIKNLVDVILKNPSADLISKLIGSVITFDAENKRLKFIIKEIPQELSQSKNDLENLEVTQETIVEAIEIARKKKLESLSFKLPFTFGNLDFKVKGEKRLKHLTSKFIELLTSTSNNIVKINDNMVGHGKMLTDGDVAINGGIGGLIGNLLILDKETNMLKFRIGEESLPKDAKKLFQNLKREISECENLNNKDLRSYKFEINIQGFPRLSLISDDCDKNLVEGFLDELWFYTNQAKEDEVEKILKEEIYKNYKADKKQNEFTFRINSDAIYLKVHDEVQKWWKQPDKANYLTKSCKFFDQAEKDIIDSPLLSTLHFIYVKKFKKNIMNFSQDAIQALELDKFTENLNERILNIITDENILSSVKLDQYFENKNSNDHTFIDLDYVSRTCCYTQAISEFKQGTLHVLIIGCKKENINVEDLYKELKGVMDYTPKSSKKIILVTKRNHILAENFKKDFPYEYVVRKDDKNNLINLTHESQRQVLQNSKVIFQGEEVNLGMLIDQSSIHLIDVEVLSKLMNDEVIEIGETLTNSRYKEVKDYYIDRTFSRNIKMKEGFKKANSKFFITGIGQLTKSNPQQNQDIVLISDVEEDFKKLCEKYKEHSIHWLKEERNEFIWQQSHGVLYKLHEFVDSNEQSIQEYTDIPERVVIIGAEPGMGKSTVLSRIAQKIKKSDPSLWAVRINLLDQSSRLKKWQKNKTEIDDSEAVKFLYGATDFLVIRENEEKNEQMIDNILELEDNGELALKTNEEKQIKGLTLFRVRLFYNFYKQGKIALLFDGFDEISPNYKDQVIKLLEVFKGTKVEKIWITTRPYNFQSELENKLGTFSYALKPFLQEEQRIFLRRFWKTYLKLSDLDEQRSKIFINELLHRFSESTNDQERRFGGIPLQISMIAEVFQDTFKEFYDSKSQELSTKNKQKLSENLNLNTLYKNFIFTKFYKIRFGEKKPCTNTDDPDMKEMIEEKHNKFIEDHRLLAFFEDNKLEKLLSLQERSQVHSLIKRIEQGVERTGIIIGVINGKPNFIHRTFAEYFVASYIWEKFKSIHFDKFVKNFIEIIIVDNLIKDDRIQICKFFQLETQKELVNSVDFPDKEHKLKTLLIMLVDKLQTYNVLTEEYNKQSTKLLLKIIEFSISAKEGSDLRIIRDVVQSVIDDNKLALLCVSSEMGYITLTAALITLDLLSTDLVHKRLMEGFWNYNNPLWLAAENGKLDNVQILVEKLSYDTTWKDKTGNTLLHSIVKSRQFDILRSCLKLNIIDVNHTYCDKRTGKKSLPLLDCVMSLVNTPLDVIELLIKNTDIDVINQFQINEIPVVSKVIRYSIRYDKILVNLLVENGFDLNAGYGNGRTPINEITFEFKYSSINVPRYIDGNPTVLGLYSDGIKFSIFFNLFKSLLEHGAIHNLEDRYGNTVLQNLKQTHYTRELLKAVLQTADEENDTVINLLDKISDKVLQLMIMSPGVKYSDFRQGFEISIGYSSWNYIDILPSYDNVKYYEKYQRNPPPSINERRLEPDYIEKTLYKHCDIKITDTLKPLPRFIEKFPKKMERSIHDSYRLYNVLLKLKRQVDVSSISKPDNILLKIVEDFYLNQNYEYDEAFNEVSEEASKLTEKFQSYVKNLSKLGAHEQTRVYKSDDVLNILGIKDLILKINESNGISDLLSKINESDGIYFLNEVLLKLSIVGQKNKKEVIESTVSFSEQLASTLELLNAIKLLQTIDDLFDAIKTDNKESVVSILQDAESWSFIEAVVNVRNKQRKTILELAYENGNVEIIDLLGPLAEKYKKI